MYLSTILEILQVAARNDEKRRPDML